MVRERADLREALIREAIVMLGAGEADLSLRSVARAAGVSAMAPYRHFSDKAALLGAVAAQGFAELRQDLERADAGADAADALVDQGLAYIAFAQRRPSLFRLMFASADLACIPHEAGRGAYEILARRVGGVAPHLGDLGSLACWGMVHGLATLRLDRRIDAEPEDLRAALVLLTQAFAKR